MPRLWFPARAPPASAWKLECCLGAESADRYLVAVPGVRDSLLRALRNSRETFAKALLASSLDSSALCRDHSVWRRQKYSLLSLRLAGSGRNRSALGGAALILAAIFTDAVNLKSVARGRVVVAASDFLFQLVYLGGKEFH